MIRVTDSHFQFLNSLCNDILVSPFVLIFLLFCSVLNETRTLMSENDFSIIPELRRAKIIIKNCGDTFNRQNNWSTNTISKIIMIVIVESFTSPFLIPNMVYLSTKKNLKNWVLNKFPTIFSNIITKSSPFLKLNIHLDLAID